MLAPFLFDARGCQNQDITCNFRALTVFTHSFMVNRPSYDPTRDFDGGAGHCAGLVYFGCLIRTAPVLALSKRLAQFEKSSGECRLRAKTMTEKKMIALVSRYFQGADQQNFDDIAATLSEDCVFTVETHGVKLQGHAEIAAMFSWLWENHTAVEHKDFSYVVSPNCDRIATQFTVVNTELDGSLTTKSNCNFFRIQDGKFTHVAVYMAGPNTLDAA